MIEAHIKMQSLTKEVDVELKLLYQNRVEMRRGLAEIQRLMEPHHFMILRDIRQKGDYLYGIPM